jgi:hypothetical protein
MTMSITHKPAVEEAINHLYHALGQMVPAALEARDNPSEDFQEARKERWHEVKLAAKELEELGAIPSIKFK